MGAWPAGMPTDHSAASPDPAALLRSPRFLVVLLLAAVVGVVASIASWGFLQLIHYTQEWVFTDLPRDLGFDGAPLWWSLPVLALAGVVTAFAIARLPGRGGHIPAYGLNAAPTPPEAVPGVVLAALASIGLGTVIGPEAPLIAMGGGIGAFAVSRLGHRAPKELSDLIAASATFAAVSFLFGSPIIAAVLLIEATGIGGGRLPLVLVPGLLASGIGSLVWIGLGSSTGLNTSDIAFSALKLPSFAEPSVGDFGWTIALAIAVAVVTWVIFVLAREVVRVAERRLFVVLPVVGVAVGGLAIAFTQTTDKGVEQVLFSGQDQLGALVQNPGAWSVTALLLVMAFKGIAYGLSLGSFRGGPTFPAMFLGAVGGILAAKLPGFELTPAVAVGIATGVVSVLRLPLSAVVLALVLTGGTGAGSGPLVIVGVIVALLVTVALPAPRAGQTPSSDEHAAAEAPRPTVAG
jgi:H+/Cl- antiporter ClcA